MRILVTGATGYVGSRLVAALLREAHEVVVASRNLERIGEFGFFDGLPKVNARRVSLAARPTVHYPDPDSPVWRQATADPVDMAEQRELRLVLEQALAQLPVSCTWKP